MIKTQLGIDENTLKVDINLTVILSGPAILLTRITSKTRPNGDLENFLPLEV